MEYVLYIALLPASLMTAVQSVSLKLQPNKLESDSKLTLICRKDGNEQGWRSEWYLDSELILTANRTSENECNTAWKRKTGIYNNTQVDCIKNSGQFQIIFPRVSSELNNTKWRCKIDQIPSNNVTIEVAEKSAVTLQISPQVIKLGTKLEMICEYSNQAWMSIWTKDGTEVLQIVKKPTIPCHYVKLNKELVRNKELENISVTCPTNASSGQFILTFLEVKEALNNTHWGCGINNDTSKMGGSKQIRFSSDKRKADKKMKEETKLTAYNFLVIVSATAGSGLLLVILITVFCVCAYRKRRQQQNRNSEKSIDTKNNSKDTHGQGEKNRDSLVVQENELYDSSTKEDCKRNTIEGMNHIYHELEYHKPGVTE